MAVRIPFTSFAPDLPALDNPGMTKLHNVTPGRGASQGGVTLFPIKSATLFSSTSMSSRPLGTAIGQDSAGNARVYGGDFEHLYKLAPDTRQWTNISRPAGYSTTGTERWKSVEYGRLQIFTNWSNEPQFINMDTDLQFADLTTLVKGRHIATHKGFVILGNTYDAFDGSVPYRVRWSGIEAPSEWSPSPANQADFQDIQGFGGVQGIVTDDSCYVLLQRGIVQIQYIGAPYVFQFTDRVVGIGCSVPESVITVSGRHFFLSDDGFYQLQGGNLTPIGNGRVDRWFLDKFDSTQAHLMTVTADPRETIVTWQFSSEDAEPGKPDFRIHYNYELGEWTTSAATVSYQFNSVSLPWTLDQLDTFVSIDEVPASFDSPIWAGGKAMLWGMSDTGAIYSFGGPNLVAEIETPEYQASKLVSQDDRIDIAQIRAVRPLFEGDGVGRIQIGTKKLQNSDIDWGEMRETNAETGFAYFREKSRYQRFRLTIAGDWQRAFGIEIDARSAGRR